MSARPPVSRRRLDWKRRVRRAVAAGAGSPFFLFAAEPLLEGLDALRPLEESAGIPVRHWLSFKTQPLRPLLRWWKAMGRSVEVVSEFELRAVLTEGFAPERILVNGPAKHAWLHRHEIHGLRVNFDSLVEVDALSGMASRLGWSVGLRLRTSAELMLEDEGWPVQFGMPPSVFVRAAAALRRRRIGVEMVHFHLRTNVPSAGAYDKALEEAAEACRVAGVRPRYVDCGGGLPPPFVRGRSGELVDANMDLGELGRVFRRRLGFFPEVRELWLENGRYLLARTGVLVGTVLVVKDDGRKYRHCICDAGRTGQAMVATWETHDLWTLPSRRGPTRETLVMGPTCMAFDRLSRVRLPGGLRAGDRVIWADAGAYQLAWETRFSHPLAEVWWQEGDQTSLVRARESFERWWGQWS